MRREYIIGTDLPKLKGGSLGPLENDVQGALESYGTAESLYPENIEIKYWHAVSLANAGMVEKSLPIFKSVFAADKNWLVLTERLPAVELLKVSNEDYEKITSQQ